MKRIQFKHITNFGLILVMLLWGSCSGTKSATASMDKDKKVKATETNGVYQTLADYLRRYPSVRVSGNGDDVKVFVRNLDTINGDVEPLFVLDGSPIGDSYAVAARMVDVNDIKSVNVLTGVNATSEFGMRGTQGVVVIKTKSKNNK